MHVCYFYVKWLIIVLFFYSNLRLKTRQRALLLLLTCTYFLSIRREGQLHTSIYDKRDDFNFHTTNFPFLCSNIPASPAYGVVITQLIRYARAYSSYGCFVLRATRLSNMLLEQIYVMERLKSSLKKFYVRYGDLVKQYDSVPLSNARMLNVAWLTIRLYANPWPFLYRTRPFTDLWEVFIEHLRRV